MLVKGATVECQGITCTNAGLLPTEALGTNFCIFIKENAFENNICKMSAILFKT